MQRPSTEAVDAWEKHGLHEAIREAWEAARKRIPVTTPKLFDLLMEANAHFHAADEQTEALRAAAGRPAQRTGTVTDEELLEARELLLECARKLGAEAAKRGEATPPAAFNQENETARKLLRAWLAGWEEMGRKDET